MKFSLEQSTGLSIHSYTEGAIMVAVPANYPRADTTSETPDKAGLTRVSHSLIITVNELITDWPPSSLDELELSHFDPILAMEPELVLFGSGDHLLFPKPEFTARLNDQGVGLEIMDTGAACRTFNILVAEGRHVAAALMMI